MYEIKTVKLNQGLTNVIKVVGLRQGGDIVMWCKWENFSAS